MTISATALPSDVDELRRTVRGAVLVPGSPGWEQVTSVFNVTFTQHPALVAVPADADDVVTLVRYAAAQGIQVVPQRTGHNAIPLGSIQGTLLLRTDAMTDVHLDAERRRAVVGAGATWADVVPAASDLGLAALHGSTPDVSVAGYSMGGGLGWYARAHGLATNSVTAIQVVTADGRLRWVDQDHEPDLFWAMRGGGGNFGVVTALEFRLYPIAEVYAGLLFFPSDRAAEVLKAWLDWTRTAPETVTSVGRLLRFPDIDDIPEPLRGGSYVAVEAIFIDQEREAVRLLAPLRRLGPVLDTFATQPPAGIAELHMDPREPLPFDTDHLVLCDVTHESVDDLMGAVDLESGTGFLGIEFRHLGGALSRAEPGHGALARMPGQYLLFGVGATPRPEEAATVRSDLDAMVTALKPLAVGRYWNFSEHQVDPGVHFADSTYARLRRIRAAVDPGNVIRANHAIPGTSLS